MIQSSPVSATTGAAAIQIGDRPDNYYSADRQDIADLLPAVAKRVLEIGCGEGRLGKLLRGRGHYVAGLELVPEMAEKARQNLDEVYCGDIEQTQLPIADASFDALIFADVLEHLVDPWKTLGYLATLLRPGGYTIASIPNVQNYRIVRDLLRGKWQYTDSGLMDRGHLRFFTYRQIVALFKSAAIEVIDRRCLYNRTLKRRIYLALTLGKIEPFFVRQYLVVGRKNSTP
ncbi:MAG: class I SAM-dependent methyltransferase [Planctomycetota bacterium]|nr:class I SAM-dependent methyltransferase [Planctomycetota bacterium]